MSEKYSEGYWSNKSIVNGKNYPELVLDWEIFDLAQANLLSKILGEPNEIDTVDVAIEDEDVSIEQWHYDELELSLSFDDYEDELLDTFAISSTDYTLNGISLIGKSIYEIDSMIEQLNLGECLIKKIFPTI